MTTPAAPAAPPPPARGQVWADDDPRAAGRTLRIDATDRTHAVCTVLTNADDVQTYLNSKGYSTALQYTDRRGTQVQIRLDRFRPGSSGYRYLRTEDAP